ncbi:MAG: YraN family protein [Lachnospiraceae bacterium]|nr:YraN family protein [Lachnospiraceae bacterium]
MNTREIGAKKEELAAEYLKEKGMKILERNFRNRHGEIDIIGRHEDYLVFVEVKYRRSLRQGSPAQAVDYKKQKQICKVADYYRMIHKLGESTPVRYDVVAICEEEVSWIKNAFYHIGR